MPHTLILVAGYAGSGKTRVGNDIARQLPACYLDKDTLGTPFVERLLVALEQPPGDRDSPIYRAEIRPLEYEALTATGIEAAALGADVVLSAPFLVQLVDEQWVEQLVTQAAEAKVQLRVVWVSSDHATLQRRMSERGSVRDRVKLADWDAYAANVDVSLDQQFAVESWRFDNSERADYAAEMTRLLAHLRNV